jgi:hypothetical protein
VGRCVPRSLQQRSPGIQSVDWFSRSHRPSWWLRLVGGPSGPGHHPQGCPCAEARCEERPGAPRAERERHGPCVRRAGAPVAPVPDALVAPRDPGDIAHGAAGVCPACNQPFVAAFAPCLGGRRRRCRPAARAPVRKSPLNCMGLYRCAVSPVGHRRSDLRDPSLSRQCFRGPAGDPGWAAHTLPVLDLQPGRGSHADP